MLKPETISVLEIVKLNTDNASKSRADGSSGKGILGQTSRKEIDIMDVSATKGRF